MSKGRTRGEEKAGRKRKTSTGTPPGEKKMRQEEEDSGMEESDEETKPDVNILTIHSFSICVYGPF